MLQALIAEADARDSDSYRSYEPDRESDYGKPAPVTVVTFGCPTTGDATWSANFNIKVNARNIVFKGDIIPKVIQTWRSAVHHRLCAVAHTKAGTAHVSRQLGHTLGADVA